MVALLALLCAACAGGEELAEPGLGGGGTGQVGEQNVELPIDQSIAAPTLSETPESSCTTSVPLQGVTDPGAAISGLAGGQRFSTTADDNGRFCIDVGLNVDSATSFEVWVEDGVANKRSPSATASVGACAPADGDDGVNVAPQGTIVSSESPDEHSDTQLNDGDAASWASWSGGSWYWPWGDYNGWIQLKLDQAYAVEKVVVHWRDAGADSGDFGEVYQLLYSGDATPGVPDPQQWRQHTVSAGDGGSDTFALGGQEVRHVALWLQRDAQISLWETFAVAEIEVFVSRATAAQLGALATGGPTCASVGSVENPG